MTTEPIAPAIPATGAEVKEVPGSIIDEAAKGAQASDKSILDESIDEAGQAENKRLLEADPKTLNEKELADRKVLEDAKKAEGAKVVPEKYEIKIPEGFSKDMSLLETLTPVLREIGVTGEQAQKLADAYMPFFKAKAEEGRKAIAAEQEANFKNFLETEKKNTMEKLGATAKTDLVFAAKARDRFFSKESQEMLNATGIANNHAIILDLIKIGKMISEDKLVEGKRITSDTRSDGEVLYGGKDKDKGE